MAQTTAGLPGLGYGGAGRSRYFNFQYEATLSAERGVQVATAMLAHGDDDLGLLVDWFSGRHLHLSYPWFRFGEGNKGEALSRFLGAEEPRAAYPGLAQAPSLVAGDWICSRSWLNGPRQNFLEVDTESTDPDDSDVGGSTLFLCYLRDQGCR